MNDGVGASEDPWVAADRDSRVSWRTGARVAVLLSVIIGVAGPTMRAATAGSIGVSRVALALAGAAVAALMPSQLLKDRRVAGVALLALCLPIGALLSADGGEGPLVLVPLGVVVAFFALRGGVQVGGGRWGGSAGLALPVLVAAQVLWVRGGQIHVAVALVAAAAVVVVLYEQFPSGARAAEAHLLRLLIRLADVIGLVAVFVVAVPALYLPGLVMRAVTRASSIRRPERRSGWVERTVAADPIGGGAKLPYAQTPRPVRRRRSAAGAAVLVTLAIGTLLLREGATDAPAAPANSSERAGSSLSSDEIMERIAAIEAFPYSRRPAYAGVSFADDLQAELLRFPLVVSEDGSMGLGDFSGRFMNARDGVRASLEPECVCPRVSLWFVGGSAAFGMGQRDEHTIASELVRLAGHNGIRLEVRNLGVPGWTLWQEYRAVIDRLDRGEGPPDLVVFYDGYNDVVGTVLEATVDGSVEGPAVLDPDDVARFVPLVVQGQVDVDGERLGRLSAQRYADVARSARRRLEERGVDVAFFFQPDAFTTPVQRAPVDDLFEAFPGLHDLAELEQSLEAAASDLSPDVVNMRGVFDEHPRPVFADSVHHNEEGAHLVARELFERLRSDLVARAGVR